MRGLRLFLVLFGLLPACALGSESDPSIAQALSGTAGVKLNGSSARITLTSDTEWSLAKTGAVNATAKTVTWTVTATKGTTTSGLLVVNGTFRVTNNGSGGATIGNIVANLQTRVNNAWVTRSSVVADATQDDGATTANISPTASSEGKSTITENPASGDLIFMDAKTNSLFALVPQVTLAAGASKTLLFTASYDNNLLALAPGTKVRIEVIVSFGNAANSASTTPNVDINGNGIIDADEARVRSVPARMTVTVPQSVPGNTTVALKDTVDDLETTGTVTFSNAQFNLGATSGTVTVSYDPGTSGGTITNCAHLTSQSQSVTSGGFAFPNIIGVDLEACDTQAIGVHSCTPGTVGCGWEDGDLFTSSQGGWGEPAAQAGSRLAAGYDSVYPFSVVEIGLAGTTGFSTVFTNTMDIFEFLPAIGTPGVFTSDLLDPGTTSAGEFAGHVLALTFNIDFSDAGLLPGSSGLKFGDLTLCNFSAQPALNGISVHQFLAIVNSAIGGATVPYSLTTLSGITEVLNLAFAGGAVSTWAQEHLFNGACP